MVLKQETGLEVQLGLAAAFSPEHLPLDNGALIVKIPTSVVWPPLLEVLQTGGSWVAFWNHSLWPTWGVW